MARRDVVRVAREAQGSEILRDYRAEHATVVLTDGQEVPVGAAVSPVRVYVPDGQGGMRLKETVSAVDFRARGDSLSHYRHLMSVARGRAVSTVRRTRKGRPKPKARWGAQAT